MSCVPNRCVAQVLIVRRKSLRSRGTSRCGDPGAPQAAVHPRPKDYESATSLARGNGVRSGSDFSGCAAPPCGLPGLLSDDGDRLCPPCSPGHMVLGAALSVELVD